MTSRDVWAWLPAMPEPISDAARILGERVRKRRERLGISQEALADRAELHWTFVGQVERGQRNISLHNLLKLAAGLGVDPGKLIQGLDPPPESKKSSRRS
jgi:transcriptional regulator with XRE-family HTH domain